MGLGGCGAPSCNCGITSSSLIVDQDDGVFNIEAQAFVICTSLTRPASPTQWLHIFETDTGRQFYWNGTHWVWIAGNPPSFQIERQTPLSLVTSGTEQTVTLPTEVIDTDASHTGSDGFITIPATWGGDWVIFAHGQFDNSATGMRYVRLVVASNATPPVQNNNSRVGGYAMIDTVNNGFPYTDRFRLEAGATVTLRALQTTGGAFDIETAFLKGHLINHIPSLT